MGIDFRPRRNVDDLGRVVLPAEMRRTLGIGLRDAVSICVSTGRTVVPPGSIIVTPVIPPIGKKLAEFEMAGGGTAAEFAAFLARA